MDSKMFGEIALQLLSQSQVSGSDLDTALKFRDLSKELANGKSKINNQNMKGDNNDDATKFNK